jgi:uncharacterized membrane protein
MKKEQNPAEITIKRIGGYFHRVVPILDEAGNVISHSLKPFMVEFRLRDLMQVIVGASLLAIPVAFTEEVWKLSTELPMANVLGLSALSLLFIGLFVFFNFYRFHLGKHWLEYCKRVIHDLCDFLTGCGSSFMDHSTLPMVDRANGGD